MLQNFRNVQFNGIVWLRVARRSLYQVSVCCFTVHSCTLIRSSVLENLSTFKDINAWLLLRLSHVRWFQHNSLFTITGATKSVYAPEPFDVGRILQADISTNDQTITVATSGPIDPGLSALPFVFLQLIGLFECCQLNLFSVYSGRIGKLCWSTCAKAWDWVQCMSFFELPLFDFYADLCTSILGKTVSNSVVCECLESCEGRFLWCQLYKSILEENFNSWSSY